jgi:sialic acid synthase SpsE
MQIVLDLGSGNTCGNSIDYGIKMIDEIIAVDNHKHEIILKMQLFKDQPPNEHLKRNVFAAMFEYARLKGYKMTASVFDMESLKFLLTFKDLPFIKIACRPDLKWIIGEVPRKIPVYASADFSYSNIESKEEILFCIPKYPAQIKEYLPVEGECCCSMPNVINISDHTIGIELFKRYKDKLHIWEKHFVLEYNDTNPDAGPFAITPQELKEALEL